MPYAFGLPLRLYSQIVLQKSKGSDHACLGLAKPLQHLLGLGVPKTGGRRTRFFP